MTLNQKSNSAELAGKALGALLVGIVMLVLMLFLAAWPLMLWVGQLHAHVSPSIPAVSYVGAMSMVGFLWTAGWIMGAASDKVTRK